VEVERGKGRQKKGAKKKSGNRRMQKEHGLEKMETKRGQETLEKTEERMPLGGENLLNTSMIKR